MTYASSLDTAPAANNSSAPGASAARRTIIVNADDWGRNRETTDRIAECIAAGVVSSTSAMVFMEDSERAAALAGERGVDAGLHLNLSSPLTAVRTPSKLVEHQERVRRFLTSGRAARFLYHPLLTASFEYAVRSQLDEFARLYGAMPARVDGHHHMHLCANVWLQRLLPEGLILRRNFTPEAKTRGSLVQLFRRWQDAGIEKRYRTTDYFFSLPPLDLPARLPKILELAKQFTVEVETHPVNPAEYRFLMDGDFARNAGSIAIASRYAVPLSHPA